MDCVAVSRVDCNAHCTFATPTPCVTQDVIACAKQVLGAFRDCVDDDLFQCYCKEVPGFEDVWYAMFELDLHYNSDDKVTGDSDQEEVAMIMNKGAKGEQCYNILRACHEYAAFVQYVERTQAGRDIVAAFYQH